MAWKKLKSSDTWKTHNQKVLVRKMKGTNGVEDYWIMEGFVKGDKTWLDNQASAHDTKEEAIKAAEIYMKKDVMQVFGFIPDEEFAGGFEIF